MFQIVCSASTNFFSHEWQDEYPIIGYQLNRRVHIISDQIKNKLLNLKYLLKGKEIYYVLVNIRYCNNCSSFSDDIP